MTLSMLSNIKTSEEIEAYDTLNNHYEIRNRNTKKVIMEVHESSLVKCPIGIRRNNDL